MYKIKKTGKGPVRNMSETAQLILSLRSVGWDDKDINNLILYVGTGDERYKPLAK